MKKIVRTILVYAEEIVSAFFISITVSMVIVNVFFRYVLNRGIFWSEEVATIAFVWSVFVGAAACHKHKMHISIDLFSRLAPKPLKKSVRMLAHLIMIVLNTYIVYLSVVFVRASSIKPTAVLGISSSYVSSAVLVGFALMTIHSVGFFFKELRGGMPAEEGA
ncbi:MAG: TRAP transporter small permease [Synergistaceae bacterium]|nr:TRAP transporter small permease [Synergistota bacterium]NLM71007.1 TRAP transporter small permease [Synergistaceae bacterium]